MGWFASLREKFFGKKEEGPGDICSFEEAEGLVVKFIACGHIVSREATWTFWGERKIGVCLDDKHVSEVDGEKIALTLCPRCEFEELSRLSIRCVLCGVAIFPGEPVAVYSRRSRGMRKKIGTLVGENYLGCMSWDCCPSGGFWGGHWTENGFISAFPDGGSVADEVMRTGKPIVGNIETGEVKIVDTEENNSGNKN